MTRSTMTGASWRQFGWLVFLALSSVAFTLGFACAAPLAAFAAFAALTQDRERALLTISAVWLINQAVGFAVLDYPWTGDTLAWGAALGAVGVLATGIAGGIARSGHGPAPMVSGFVFLGAFAAYELGLFTISAAIGVDTEAYAPMVVARIFAINMMAFVGLLLVNRVVTSAVLAVAPSAPVNLVETRA